MVQLKGQYGSGIREANSYLGQNYMIVEPSIVSELLQILRDREQFDYCVDITAVHYPRARKTVRSPVDSVFFLRETNAFA